MCSLMGSEIEKGGFVVEICLGNQPRWRRAQIGLARSRLILQLNFPLHHQRNNLIDLVIEYPAIFFMDTLCC